MNLRRIQQLEEDGVVNVDPTVDSDGLAFETVQPSLIADCAQVLNKSGKHLVRVCLAEIDKGDTFWRCMDAGNYALNVDFLASVFRSFSRLNCIYRQHCRSHRKKNGENQEKERFHFVGFRKFQEMTETASAGNAGMTRRKVRKTSIPPE